MYTTDLITYRTLTTTDATGQYAENMTMAAHLEYFLQLLFRKERFRDGQLPILNRALRNRSVIGLLPTGGGKSLTYQLAALLQPGITLVVDPLQSLMKVRAIDVDSECVKRLVGLERINGNPEKPKEESTAERMIRNRTRRLF